MKRSLQQFLICPSCRGELEVEAVTSDGPEILEGFLRCLCGLSYPIIGGVPRMLPQPLLATLAVDYPDFFRNHGKLPTDLRVGRAREEKVQRQIQRAFGFEWTWSADYHAENFRDWLPQGLSEDTLFRGKIGLEVACGAGRHAARVSSMAAEHFAVDLSKAVDVAFAQTRDRVNCHVIQADAFHLPFTDRMFDYVYCLGALQHMYDPPAAFQRLAKMPREGGVLVVNVYQNSRPMLQHSLEAFRKITTRLPSQLVAKISLLTGLAEYGFFIGPWKLIRNSPLGTNLAWAVPERIKEYARHDLQTCYTDWYDRLSCPVKMHFGKGDVIGWYASAGYRDVVVTPYWKAFWNAAGRRGVA